MNIPFRHTKILTTIGPASNSPEMLEKLFNLGVNAFRMNFSHGTHDDHKKVYEALRALEKKYGRPVTILQDLQGPKIRISTFEDDAKIQLNEGNTFTLDNDPTPGNQERVHLPHPMVLESLRKNDEIFINDGLVKLRVTKASKEKAICTVLTSGIVSNRKGVNLPTVDLPVSALTEKDREDLAFGLELGVDWVALSFVQRPEDIEEAKEIIQGRAAIIAKIEKPNAVERIDGIIQAANGVMIARGDLGVEMPLEQLPAIQRTIISKCRMANRPVVVATQMLESMIVNATPTRAEVSDVANGVYAGADCLMLSAETASGDHPLGAVSVMSRVIEEVEQTADWNTPTDRRSNDTKNASTAITAAATHVASSINAKALFTFTESGSTARRMARQRPRQPIYVITPHIQTSRILGLVWGLTSHVREAPNQVKSLSGLVLEIAEELGFTEGDIVLTAGKPFGVSGTTNLLRIVSIEQGR